MDYKLLLDTAVMAGELMLANGAETYRVEDTMHRMLSLSGLKTAEAFVVVTGFLVTLDDPSIQSMTVTRRIQSRGTNLSIIDEINSISRGLCGGELELEEAFRQIKKLKKEPHPPQAFLLANAGVAAAFALTYGGTWQEAFVAGVARIFHGHLPVSVQLHEAALLLRNPAERRGNLTVRRRTSEVSSYYREPGFHHHRGHHAPGSRRGHHQRGL